MFWHRESIGADRKFLKTLISAIALAMIAYLRTVPTGRERSTNAFAPTNLPKRSVSIPVGWKHSPELAVSAEVGSLGTRKADATGGEGWISA